MTDPPSGDDRPSPGDLLPADAPPGPLAPAYPAYPVTGFAIPYGYARAMDPGDPDDPLVTPPSQDYSGWWRRLQATFLRSWVALLPIVLLLSVIPAAVESVFTSYGAKQILDPWLRDRHLGHPAMGIPAFIGGLLLVLLVVAFATGGCWSAGIWTVVRQAAGEPAPFGAAMSYAGRNILRVGFWSIVYAVMVGVGFVLCVLPGLYFAVAGCLVIPFAIFQAGRNPVSESFRMVHAHFGAVIPRIATLFGLNLVVGFVTQTIGDVVQRPGSLIFGGTDVGGIVSAALMAPVTMIFIIGVLLTFAEFTAHSYPTDTARLSRAL